jgi:hypothetical protein
MADWQLPTRKEGQQQEALRSCTNMSNFGLHFWPRVTRVTLIKYGNVGYLTWRFQFWGRKRDLTLLKVFFIASHLVE